MEQQRYVHDCHFTVRHIHRSDMGVLRPSEKTGNGLGELSIREDASHPNKSKAAQMRSLFHL